MTETKPQKYEYLAIVTPVNEFNVARGIMEKVNKSFFLLAKGDTDALIKARRHLGDLGIRERKFKGVIRK